MLPSLCKIAWEWFLVLVSSCFRALGKCRAFFACFMCDGVGKIKQAKNALHSFEKTSAYCVGRKPLERWQSVGRVGRKNDSDSVPMFLLVFFSIINEMKQTKI